MLICGRKLSWLELKLERKTLLLFTQRLCHSLGDGSRRYRVVLCWGRVQTVEERRVESSHAPYKININRNLRVFVHLCAHSDTVWVARTRHFWSSEPDRNRQRDLCKSQLAYPAREIKKCYVRAKLTFLASTSHLKIEPFSSPLANLPMN